MDDTKSHCAGAALMLELHWFDLLWVRCKTTESCTNNPQQVEPNQWSSSMKKTTMRRAGWSAAAATHV